MGLGDAWLNAATNACVSRHGLNRRACCAPHPLSPAPLCSSLGKTMDVVMEGAGYRSHVRHVKEDKAGKALLDLQQLRSAACNPEHWLVREEKVGHHCQQQCRVALTRAGPCPKLRTIHLLPPPPHPSTCMPTRHWASGYPRLPRVSGALGGAAST